MTRRRMLEGTGAALLGAGLLGVTARHAAANDTALDPTRAAALTALLAALAHGPAPALDTAAYADDWRPEDDTFVPMPGGDGRVEPPWV